MIWSNEEISLLQTIWNKLSRSQEATLYFPNKSLAAIRNKAENLGLYTKKISSLSFLMSDTLESYYWMGFLLADGSFNCTSGVMTVDIHEKDKDYLNRLAIILNTEIKIYKKETCSIVRVNCGDKDNFKSLITKWDLCSNKTKNPPKRLPEMNFDQFSAWTIGFIDGDGSIEKEGDACAITVDASWEHILKEIKDRYNLTNLKLRCQTTAFSKNFPIRLRFTAKSVRDLKKFAVINNLPYMARKWDRVKLAD